MSEKSLTSSATPIWQPLAVIAALAVFIFVFPRVLISSLGADNPWTSYLYLYVFGFIYFGLGMVLIRKTGALKMGRGRDSFWWKVMIAGFCFFAGLHALWICLALFIPFKGA